MSYTNKTQPTKVSPERFLTEYYKGREKLQQEALVLIKVYATVTGSPCVMWNKIFGFGTYQYQDSTGGTHTHLVTGFAISSTGFTLYNMMGWKGYESDLQKLGKYKFSGISCLAIKSIEDIDLKILKVVVKKSIADMTKKYKTEF